MIEHDLLREAQTGNIEAYTELQLLLEPEIRRFIRRMISMGDIEDDIVQDVFIAFYRSLVNIYPVENLRPYLFRIARNRCYDELRYLGRYDEFSLDEEPAQVWVSFTEAHNQPRPDDVTHWLLLHMEVQEAMLQLPENQRQALILYSEEEMTYAEIAEVMRVSIGTVKSRVFYAKKTLRQLLRPETIQALDAEFGKAAPNRRNTQEMMEEKQDEPAQLPEPAL